MRHLVICTCQVCPFDAALRRLQGHSAGSQMGCDFDVRLSILTSHACVGQQKKLVNGPKAHGPRAHGPRAHGPMGPGPSPWAQDQGPWARGPWAQGPRSILNFSPCVDGTSFSSRFLIKSHRTLSCSAAAPGGDHILGLAQGGGRRPWARGPWVHGPMVPWALGHGLGPMGPLALGPWTQVMGSRWCLGSPCFCC